MPSPTAIILGAGPRIGSSLATTFSNKGYTIALASRSGTNTKTEEGHLSLAADFSDPSTIPSLFQTIKETFGAAPAVVIYNAASLTPPQDEGSILSIPTERFVTDLNVNVVSPFVAAQEAVRAWQEEGESEGKGEVKKTFIYTGNLLNERVLPVGMFLDLGVGKSGAAYWVGAADGAYRGRGYRFFYADQRAEDGGSQGNDIDGPAHAEFYSRLAERENEGDVPWHATFVKGKGYVKF